MRFLSGVQNHSAWSPTSHRMLCANAPEGLSKAFSVCCMAETQGVVYHR